MSLPEHIDANNSSGDEDDAPLLVDATAQTQSSQVLDEDAPKIRVPITIVTGKITGTNIISEITTRRISWSRQNYAHEFCFERAAWKEDRSDTEWYTKLHESFNYGS